MLSLARTRRILAVALIALTAPIAALTVVYAWQHHPMRAAITAVAGVAVGAIIVRTRRSKGGGRR